MGNEIEMIYEIEMIEEKFYTALKSLDDSHKKTCMNLSVKKRSNDIKWLILKPFVDAYYDRIRDMLRALANYTFGKSEYEIYRTPLADLKKIESLAEPYQIEWWAIKKSTFNNVTSGDIFEVNLNVFFNKIRGDCHMNYFHTIYGQDHKNSTFHDIYGFESLTEHLVAAAIRGPRHIDNINVWYHRL